MNGNDSGASPSGDQVVLRGLRVLGICGVEPHEQERPQPLELDMWLSVDTTEAARTDDLGLTVDYSEIVAEVSTMISGERFFLLESLAVRVAEMCLMSEKVRSVTVEVRKLRPPVSHQLATAGVRVSRP